jgi:hypothetical protein
MIVDPYTLRKTFEYKDVPYILKPETYVVHVFGI